MDHPIERVVLSVPPWRRAALFGCLLLLGLGYVGAFALFRTQSHDFIAAEQDRRAQQFALFHPTAVPGQLNFSHGQNGVRHLGHGWHAAESDGVWSDGKHSLLVVATRCACNLQLTLHLGMLTSRHVPKNGATILINGQSLARAERDAGNAWEPVRFSVPRSSAETGLMAIEIRLDNGASPFRDGDGEDRRVLGVKLTAIDIDAALP
jgi:hypothetical protein